MQLTPPTLDDIRAARPHVYAAMQASPLLPHPRLSEAIGADVYVKHENHNPTGAFKVRGALAAAASLPPGQEILAASAGNHALGIAWAANRLGLRATLDEWGCATGYVLVLDATGATRHAIKGSRDPAVYRQAIDEVLIR